MFSINIWQFGKRLAIWLKQLIVYLYIIKKVKISKLKRFKSKENFQYSYITVILFDSVYKKDGNLNPKVILEKFIHNFFRRNIKKFGFCCFGSSSWSIRKFRFLKHKKIFRGFRFPKHKESFLLRKNKEFFSGLLFQKYNNNILLRKYKKFFNIRVRKLHFLGV